MFTFLKYAFVISLGAVIFIPLIKMAIDFAANKVTMLQPVAAYVDKA